MKIKIKNKTITLSYSMRIYIIYENIIGQSLSFETMNSYTSLIVLFYSAIMATIQKKKLDITINYDEFIDWLDSNNGEQKVKEFSEWFTNHLTNNLAMQDTTTEDSESNEEQPKN